MEGNIKKVRGCGPKYFRIRLCKGGYIGELLTVPCLNSGVAVREPNNIFLLQLRKNQIMNCVRYRK
jgi:hypothetical protein